MRQKKKDHAKTKKSNENAMTLSKNTQMLSTKPQFHQNNAIALKKSCGNNENFYCIQRHNGQTLVRKPLSQTVLGPENV